MLTNKQKMFIRWGCYGLIMIGIIVDIGWTLGIAAAIVATAEELVDASE